MNNWTRPFYGVSHLRRDSKKGYQYTIVEFDTGVMATVIPLENHPFIRSVHRWFDRVAEAKKWLEQEADKRTLEGEQSS